jgi:hypothetical protein
MRGRYVKMIGASDLPLDNDPFIQIPSLATRVRFPRDQFPRDMKKGDELLYYAVGGYKKLFAQVRLTGDPEHDVPTGDPERGIPNEDLSPMAARSTGRPRAARRLRGVWPRPLGRESASHGRDPPGCVALPD